MENKLEEKIHQAEELIYTLQQRYSHLPINDIFKQRIGTLKIGFPYFDYTKDGYTQWYNNILGLASLHVSRYIKYNWFRGF